MRYRFCKDCPCLDAELYECNLGYEITNADMFSQIKSEDCELLEINTVMGSVDLPEWTDDENT
jgi:hypothetical protein